jgi:voltage-gated sodium channel
VRWFEPATACVIVANTGVLVAGLMVEGHEGLFELAHDGCLAFFVVELLVRLRRGGWSFFKGRWNCFDTAVIALSVTPWLGVDTSLLRLARLVHLMRHVSHLRLIRFFRVDAVVVAGAGLALATVFMGSAVLGLNPWL